MACRDPTLVKSLHHCQLRSLRYAAQFLCRTFMAVSCCCLLAKALETKDTVSHGVRKGRTDNPGSAIAQHTVDDKGSARSATASTEVRSGVKGLREPVSYKTLARDLTVALVTICICVQG